MVRSETTRSVPPTDAVEEIVCAVATVLWAGVRATAVGCWWVLRYPQISIWLAVVAASGYEFGPIVGGSCAVGVLVTALVWRWRWPGSFRRLISGPVWKRWRRWCVYRRPWASNLALHGLTAVLDDRVLVPHLHKVRVGYVCDVLVVRMLPGQTPTDWQRQGEPLAQAFRARAVKVEPLNPGWVQLTVQHTDPLATPIPLPSEHLNVAPTTQPDASTLTGVPVGVTENGGVWLVPVLGRHILVAGATGAGKGSVVWSVMAGLSSGIRSGLVQAWVIDPKGGMEFGAGRAMFTRFAHDNATETLTLLRDLVALMQLRANDLRGHARLLTPSTNDPLIVLVIDEIASLTAYVSDRKTKAEVEALLGLLLSQGRAVGISVLACVQDPSKEVLSIRQLFSIRIALRLTEATQVAMVLGQGARDHGAMADQIPDHLPGIGYMVEDGHNYHTRVRAFHVTDTDIDRLNAAYPTPHHPTPEHDGDGEPGEAA